MVGMGKAMAEWLELVRSGDGGPEDIALAYKGLDRVRDSLLGAAGCDVEDLVHDWTWNEGLITHKSKSNSNSNTQTPLGSPRHRPQSDNVPIPSALLPKRTVSASASAQKPLPDTPPARAESPEPAIIEEGLGAMGLSETRTKPAPPPASVPTMAAPAPDQKPKGAPALQLSTRNDTPSLTLPRIPVPAPQHPTPPIEVSPRNYAQASVHRSPEVRLHRVPSQEPSHTSSPSPNPSSGYTPSPPLDPLGGLGVSESATVERRRSGNRMRPTSSSSGLSAVEVGVDPLGAGS